ncbi:MAG TPA: hypothetical protein VIP52_05280 [Candidatus Dormibacteraeota bacterium]
MEIEPTMLPSITTFHVRALPEWLLPQLLRESLTVAVAVMAPSLS